MTINGSQAEDSSRSTPAVRVCEGPRTGDWVEQLYRLDAHGQQVRQC
jgi:hypothetical protein